MDWKDENIRHTFTTLERSLPIFIETIGYSAWERIFHRKDGYPYYHFLYTLQGKGSFEFMGERILLTPGQGVLLTPFTPHDYAPFDERWSTVYITFGGVAASTIMEALEMNTSAVYTATEGCSFGDMVGEMLEKIEYAAEFSELELSTELYRFLMMLRKFGRKNDQLSLSQYYDKLRPVVQWMELHRSDNIGLPEIAEQAGISISHLNEWFHQAFGMSPYSFLIQLRLREAKKLLVIMPNLTLKEIAGQTGFNDVSHFVATFRRKEGITPGKYRDLYLSAKHIEE